MRCDRRGKRCRRRRRTPTISRRCWYDCVVEQPEPQGEDPHGSSEDLELSERQMAELDLRLAQHLAGPEGAIPWEQIDAEFESRYGSKG